MLKITGPFHYYKLFSTQGHVFLIMNSRVEHAPDNITKKDPLGPGARGDYRHGTGHVRLHNVPRRTLCTKPDPNPGAHGNPRSGPLDRAFSLQRELRRADHLPLSRGEDRDRPRGKSHYRVLLERHLQPGPCEHRGRIYPETRDFRARRCGRDPLLGR